MLQVTETAASAFRTLLAREDVQGSAIRLAPSTERDGQPGITLVAIEEPSPGDRAASAADVTVVVASELAPELEDAILDARQTDRGAEFFLSAQGSPAS